MSDFPGYRQSRRARQTQADPYVETPRSLRRESPPSEELSKCCAPNGRRSFHLKTASKNSSQLCQGPMDERHRNRPLAHGRCNALDAICAHVAHGKNSRQAGLKHLRTAIEHPSKLFRHGIKVAAGENEPFIIECQTSSQPVGVRRGSGHYEYMADWMGLGCAAFRVPGHTFQVGVALEPDDLRAVMYVDLRILFDALNQVARHCLRQAVRSHQYVHLSSSLGQEHRGLSRRITAADDDDFFMATQLRFKESRPIIHAQAFEVRKVLDAWLVVLRSARDDDRLRGNRSSVIQINLVWPLIAIQPCHARSDQHLRAKFLRLRRCAIR